MASGIDYAAIMSPNGAAAGLGNFAGALAQLPQQRRANQLTAMRQDLEARRMAMDMQSQTNQQQFQAGQFQRQVGLDAQNAQMDQGRLHASQLAGEETVRHNKADEQNFSNRTDEMERSRKMQLDEADRFKSTLDADKYFTEEVPGPMVDHYNALLGTTDKIQTKTRQGITDPARRGQAAATYGQDLADEYEGWKRTHTGRGGQPVSGPPVDVSVPTNIPPTPVDPRTGPAQAPAGAAPAPGPQKAAAAAKPGSKGVLSRQALQAEVKAGTYPDIAAAEAAAVALGYSIGQ